MFGKKPCRWKSLSGRRRREIGDRYNALLDSVVESRIVPMVRLLADRGVEVNAGDDQRLTPLHCAAYRGHTVVVELLIAKGADVNVGTVPDPTPDSIVWESNWECRLGPGVTPLHEAAAGGEPNVAAVLLAQVPGRTPWMSRARPHCIMLRQGRIIGLPNCSLMAEPTSTFQTSRNDASSPLPVIQGDVATAKRLIAAGAGKVSLRDYWCQEESRRAAAPPPGRWRCWRDWPHCTTRRRNRGGGRGSKQGPQAGMGRTPSR